MPDSQNTRQTLEQLTRRIESLEIEHHELQQAQAALTRQNEYLTVLHETALGLIDHLDKEELLETILNRAALLAGTEHGYIYLLEPNEDEMQIRVGMGFFKGQLGRRVKIGQGLGGKVWETEQSLLIDDYTSWRGRLSDRSLDDLRCVVGIPLKTGSGVAGVIGLGHVDESKRFKPHDLTILRRFADLALIALDKARLYSDLLRELAERKRTEAVLRESEQRQRSLLESSPDPIVVYDMQGVATYVNPAFEQTFGMARDELLGKQIDFVPEESWEETRLAIDNMLQGKKISLFETRRLTKDGRVLDVQISSTLYNDSQGKPAGNIVILRDISALKAAEKQLRSYRDRLEDLVEERTAELGQTNTRLAQEVEERKRAENKLRRREKELEAQSHHLAEVNTALKVLLKQRDANKRELAENVLGNVKALIHPYIERLKHTRLNTNQETLVGILDANLNNIISPFTTRLSSRFVNFTPMEIRVANLVKEGKTNKEMAELLCLSKNTILFHRYNIRTKLGLKKKGINLRSFLLSHDK